MSKSLKQLIRERGYTQRFIARKIGRCENLLSRYNRGDRSPSPETAKKLASILEVSEKDIFFAINKHNVDK